jgi:hypothetical protein
MHIRLYSVSTLLFASSVLTAATGHRFDSSKIDVPTAKRSAYQAAHQALSSAHNGIFIPPDALFGCGGANDVAVDEATCEGKGVAYYKRIGVLDASGNPTASRGTMQAWLATNGFSLNPLSPAPGELRAVYYNVADLGFGRDLHCRSREVGIVRNDNSDVKAASMARVAVAPALSFRPGTVTACYVTNFGDTAHPQSPNGNEQQALMKAKTNSNPIATVAMEVFKPSGGAAGEVRFFVYDTGGTQALPHFTPVPTALAGPALPYAILDNETAAGGHKANPGTCMNCHGGNAPDSGTDSNPASAMTVVTGSNLLPFDAQLFSYDTSSGSAISEVAQRETMRKLNALIKASAPPSPAISSQIDGWYQWCGGVNVVGCAIDDTGHPYTPPSWATASTISGATGSVTNMQIKSFYQHVARRYCRTCHLVKHSANDDFDIQQIVGGDPGNPMALRIKSKLDPSQTSASMPMAERTFNAYWSDPQAQAAYATLWGNNCFGPGCQKD